MRTPTPSRSFSVIASALAAAALLSCGGTSEGSAPFVLNLRFCSNAYQTSCVEPTEQEFPEAMKQVFRSSASKMMSIVTRGGGPVSVNMNCGSLAHGDPQALPVHETVDGLLVFVTAINGGDSGILAQSGPCVVRSKSQLPLVSVMRFNTTYMQTYMTNTELAPVVLHEMFHTLGFGTVWEDKNLIDDSTISDPRFRGRRALAAAKQYNSAPAAWASVPVEGLGQTGTIFSHWRESTFGLELMTGWFSSGYRNPLSETSIASLQDLGYTVDVTQADAEPTYTVPTAGLRSLEALAPAIWIGDDVVHTRPAVAEEP